MKVAHITLLLLFVLIVSECVDIEDPIISENLAEYSYSKRANIWYFGQNAGLDFNDLDPNGNPRVLTDGQINTLEGCSVMCDENGRLLFYSDGVTVWNRLHEIMPNGTDLKGSFTSTQSALIVPHPGNTFLYYIFTTSPQAHPDGLNYKILTTI